MNTGCTGVAIYGTEGISSNEALEIGLSFFEAISISVNEASYYKFLKNGDHAGDHNLFEIPLDQLIEMIMRGEADAFWLYHYLKRAVPWHVAFSRQTGEFGGFHHLMAICEFPVEEIYEPLTKWLKDLAKRYPRFPYAIIYTSDNITDALFYAAGNNGTKMFPYENGFAFNKETPGRYSGKGRYSGEMLRMIYPCNLLNHRHLKIQIDGVELKQWILSSDEHGRLTSIGEDLWMWEVETKHLERVNQACGEAGFLIAWKSMEPKKSRRKLP